MARASTPDPAPDLFRCTESFAVVVDGIPQVYAAGSEVLGTDPILKTHRGFFEPAAARLVRHRSVEQATAEPGATRQGPVSGRPAADKGAGGE